MRELTPTSYALLALLGVRPWSAYELTKQVDRSFRWYWRRKDSLIYAEVKNLVEHRYATATPGATGRRPRTTYAITARGRNALRAWLAIPGRGPDLQFEALIKVAFADLGSRADLLATLAAVREHAETIRAQAIQQTREYAETGGPHPERLHVIALTAKFLLEYWNLVAEWARWAERHVEQWPQTESIEGIHIPPDALGPPLPWPHDDRPSLPAGG